MNKNTPSGYGHEHVDEQVPWTIQNSYSANFQWDEEAEKVKIGSTSYSVPEAPMFKEFDPWKHMELTDPASSNPSIIIFGPRGSGKTHIMKHLIYTMQKKKHFDKAYLFSNTAQLQHGVYDFIPKNNQHIGFKEDIIAKLIDEQRQDVMTKKANKKEKNIKRILVVLDDVIDDNKTRHSRILNQLYTQGRHLYIVPIMLSQQIGENGIAPTIRVNSDLVIGFNAGAQYDRELMSERYLSLIHKKAGEQVYNNLTNERYSCIAIYNKGICSARAYQDYVYRYKAPQEVPSFSIGSQLETEKETRKLVKFGVLSKGSTGPILPVAEQEGGSLDVMMHRPQFSGVFPTN